MQTVVISLGGSILIPGNDDARYIGRLAETIRKLSSEYRLLLVCGGGQVARYYARTGRDLGGTVDQLDMMGIDVTRVNARLVATALGDVAIQVVPHTLERAAEMCDQGVVVMGGTIPGHTTDAVAAMLAELVGADRIVNATSVDAAYSDDPRTNPGAERYSQIGFEKFKLLIYPDHDAGRSSVFDPKGAEVVLRTRTPLYIVDGRDLCDMEAAIRGRSVKGTLVSDP